MAVKLGEPVETSVGIETRNDIEGRYHRYDRVLGRGAYKTVYWGYDTLVGVDVAWNCIDLDVLPSNTERSKILREIEMLEQLSHRHILRIRDHWENTHTHQLCFITDILQGGSLREYIRARTVSLGRVKTWCLQILDALRYLHGSTPTIIHRDLKCDNIFIDGASGNITIGDLGLCTKYTTSSHVLNADQAMSIVGTVEFMAPELYEEQYDEKVDIYAFGMCLIEMVSKKYPFSECANQIQVIRKVTDKQPPDIVRQLHRYVRTFIELCIERDPRKRPSACELLQHPFLAYMDDLKAKLPVSYFAQPHTKKINVNLTVSKDTKQTSKNTNNNTMNKNRKIGKKYISGTTVTVQDSGKIEVQLKIHHENEARKVKFEYDPNTENIAGVVREMVETLKLDQKREHEIVATIEYKLKMMQISTTTTTTSPAAATTAVTATTRAVSQPPIVSTTTNETTVTTTVPTAGQPYSEPPSAAAHGVASELHSVQEQFAAPLHAGYASDTVHTLYTQQQQHQHTHQHTNGMNGYASEGHLPPPATTTTTANHSQQQQHQQQSRPMHQMIQQQPPLPVLQAPTLQPPGMLNNGYAADTESENVIALSQLTSANASALVTHHNPQQGQVDTQSEKSAAAAASTAKPAVKDSLLDQIMALPIETIKSRIVQFGGSYSDEDAAGILVTNLFQLLSANNNNSAMPRISSMNASVASLNQSANFNQDANATAAGGGGGGGGLLGMEAIATALDQMMMMGTVSANASVSLQPNMPALEATQTQTQMVPMSMSHVRSHTANVSSSRNGSRNPSPTTNYNRCISAPTELARESVLQQQATTTTASYHPSPKVSPRAAISHPRQLYEDLDTTSNCATTTTTTTTTAVAAVAVDNNGVDDGGDDDDGEDGGESRNTDLKLSKLRTRQRQLMKAKIASQREKLKQRIPSKPARDQVSIDDIAYELSQVDQQIKFLSAAVQQQNKKDRESGSKTSPEDAASVIKTEKDAFDVSNLSKSVAQTAPQTAAQSTGQSSATHSHNSSFAELDEQSLATITNMMPTTTTTTTTTLTQFAATNSSDANIATAAVDRDGLNALMNAAPMNSSPLISASRRKEFEGYLRELPATLNVDNIGGDIGDINVYLSNLCNYSDSQLCAVSDTVLQNVKERVFRERAQLEHEYEQYVSDQTEMLLLKLCKHRSNAQKCAHETQTTRQKLLLRQNKQRHKFAAIIYDQLQILHLTQELNDDFTTMASNALTSSSSVQHAQSSLSDQYHVYKQQMDQLYLTKVQQFEARQKRELNAFCADLKQLTDLKLQRQRRQSMRSSAHSTHSSPTHPQPPVMEMLTTTAAAHDDSVAALTNGHGHVNANGNNGMIPARSTSLHHPARSTSMPSSKMNANMNANMQNNKLSKFKVSASSSHTNLSNLSRTNTNSTTQHVHPTQHSIASNTQSTIQTKTQTQLTNYTQSNGNANTNTNSKIVHALPSNPNDPQTFPYDLNR